jgi:hypothetical protein
MLGPFSVQLQNRKLWLREHQGVAIREGEAALPPLAAEPMVLVENLRRLAVKKR